MMGGVSSETFWGIKKHWNNKFYYTVASCWFFPWVSKITFFCVKVSLISKENVGMISWYPYFYYPEYGMYHFIALTIRTPPRIFPNILCNFGSECSWDLCLHQSCTNVLPFKYEICRCFLSCMDYINSNGNTNDELGRMRLEVAVGYYRN